MQFDNKKINRLKIAITTKCNLSCNYCFVKKKNKTINYKIAKKSINILLLSKGKNKLLSIYGGEIFLEYKLLKRIIKYSQKKAKDINKKLIKLKSKKINNKCNLE